MSFRLHLVRGMPEDTKVTDMLYACYGQAAWEGGKRFEEQLKHQRAI